MAWQEAALANAERAASAFREQLARITFAAHMLESMVHSQGGMQEGVDARFAGLSADIAAQVR